MFHFIETSEKLAICMQKYIRHKIFNALLVNYQFLARKYLIFVPFVGL